MPSRLENNANAEKVMKTSRIGLLMSLKQHSLLHKSTHTCVCSVSLQSSQKFTKAMMNGTNRAIDTRSVMTARMRKINPRVCLKCFSPMRNSKTIASRSDSTPTANPNRCGSGPLKFTDSQAMAVDRSTIEERR